MRKALRITAASVAAVTLAACSGSESIDSNPDVNEVDVTATATVPTLSPSSTTTTTTIVTATTTEPVTTTVAAPAEVVEVPALPPPEIDGILSQDEWNGAVTFEMSDGAQIALMEAAGTLYVAVAGTEVGAVNVVIGNSEFVWILHSSAALGSALYESGADQWELSHGYSWCCRDRNDVSARLELLAEERWQANIGWTGDPGVVEYEIGMPWQGSSIAVSSIRDEADKGFWPADLSEEARSQLLGRPPQTTLFNMTEWLVLPGS